MTTGSPACPPHATLATSIIGIKSSSGPRTHGPKASPQSTLISILLIKASSLAEIFEGMLKVVVCSGGSVVLSRPPMGLEELREGHHLHVSQRYPGRFPRAK